MSEQDDELFIGKTIERVGWNLRGDHDDAGSGGSSETVTVYFTDGSAVAISAWGDYGYGGSLEIAEARA